MRLNTIKLSFLSLLVAAALLAGGCSDDGTTVQSCGPATCAGW